MPLRSLLALLLLAGAAMPSAVLLSTPATAYDGSSNDSTSSTSNDNGGLGHDPGGLNGDGCSGNDCLGYPFEDDGIGGSTTMTTPPPPPPPPWNPSFTMTRFSLPVCGHGFVRNSGLGYRVDSTYAPGWGACRR